MNLIARAIKSTPERPTRLQDSKGRLMDAASLTSIPHAVLDSVLQLCFGYRRTAPWISYRATHELDRLIEPNWRILEFGAGQSTVWFAARAKSVLSIESDANWYERVKSRLLNERLANVQLQHRPPNDLSQYTMLAEPDSSFDLALIDGEHRSECVPVCVRKVRPGGYIYLDNTDRPGDFEVAAARLVEAPIMWKRYYRDFAPGLPAIFEGILVRLADGNQQRTGQRE